MYNLIPILFQLKLIKSHFLYILIVINIIYLFIECQDNDTLNNYIKYPVTFTLSNHNIMFFSSKGIYTFNSDLSSMIYSYNFTSEINIDNNNMHDCDYPSFSQFQNDENGNIIVHVKGNIYFFNNEGKFLYYSNITNDIIIKEDITYSITKYKKISNEYFYCVIYINENKVYTLLYKINEENGKNEKIINTYYHNETRRITYNYLTCQRMKKNDNNYIVCFYFYNRVSINKFAVEIFDPNKNFSFLYQKEEEVIIIGSIYQSIVSEDESKIYICYTVSPDGSCFYYDIKFNNFSHIVKIANNCRGGMFFNRFYFFKRTKEFIFSCKDNNINLTITKFDKDMNLISNIEEFKLTNLYGLNSFAIVYIPIEQKYKIILYLYNYPIQINYFPDSIPSPKVIVEENYTTEKITIKCHNNCETCNEEPIENSENCLTCKNIKKIVNEYKNCVCNTLSGYYSLKLTDGTFDDECYTNETKPNNYYLNISYFEICYQNCLTCEIGGNEKENNCITCANNYIQSLDSNYSLTYINCVPKCPFYYYITSYNYYT